MVVMSDQPVFDFSRMSHRDSKALGRAQLRLQRLAAQLGDAAAMPDDEFEAKMSTLDAMIEEAEGYISLVLVDVPRDWLLPEAPDSLDWTDAHSLNWLRSDKMDALREAAVAARSPESVTGK